MASEVLSTISKDWNQRCYLESKLKYELDAQTKLIHAKEEGKRESDEEWQTVVADKDAKLADKDAEIADYAAENARLRAELEKRK